MSVKKILFGGLGKTKMLVGDNYKVESDTLNVTLYHKEVSKKDNCTRWRPIAYFATVKNALSHLVGLEVNNTGLKDLRTVVKKIENLETLISGLEIG